MPAGQIALVTGGGNGIGRALCRILAREGAKVVAADLDQAAAQETIKLLNNPEDHLALHMNVTDKTSVESAISSTFDKLKAPPTLIANAAGIVKDNFIMQMEEKAFMDVLDVNLKGTFLVTQAAVAAMVDHEVSSAAIVNISSISGKLGTMGQCNYAASKAGVMAFTKTSAIELASLGVRVNCILPGFTQTSIVASVPEKVVNLVIKMTPLKRMAQPEEIGEVAAFLLSKKSSFMTGASWMSPVAWGCSTLKEVHTPNNYYVKVVLTYMYLDLNNFDKLESWVNQINENTELSKIWMQWSIC